MVPDVPITRSKPRPTIFSTVGAIVSVMWDTIRRSSRRLRGSERMNCSVRRMTPSFRLCATWVRAPMPCVSSTLPPPMSITTAAPPDTSTPYTARDG